MQSWSWGSQVAVLQNRSADNTNFCTSKCHFTNTEEAGKLLQEIELERQITMNYEHLL